MCIQILQCFRNTLILVLLHVFLLKMYALSLCPFGIRAIKPKAVAGLMDKGLNF